MTMSLRLCQGLSLQCGKGWWIGTSLMALAVLLVTVRQAQAQDSVPSGTVIGKGIDEQAVQAFWKGKDHYDAGEFSQAVQEFQHAFSLTNDPDLLYNIAQSYRKMGQCAPAVENYRSFLRAAPGSPLAPQAERQAAQLQASSCVVPVTSPPSAITSSSEHDNSIQALSSRDPSHEESQVSGSRLRKVSIVHPSRVRQTWAFVALSGSVVTGGIAAGLEIWNRGRHDQWTTSDRNLAQGVGYGESARDWLVRLEANDRLARSIDRVQREALYLSIGAGALLATSAILYLWAPSEKAHPSTSAKHRVSVSVRPTIEGPQRGIVTILGTF